MSGASGWTSAVVAGTAASLTPLWGTSPRGVPVRLATMPPMPRTTGHTHVTGDPEELHAAAAVRLGADDQRYTSGRRALVELLADAPHPLTVAEVLERNEGLTQSSVYRNLAVLEATGVVDRVVTEDEFARYELAEDLTGHHHHHLICAGCGGVEDFSVPPELETAMDEVFHKVARRSGFSVGHHRMDIIGWCATCRT